MQVQVCRQCGNRNTVINKPVKKCNYCGSSDLEAVSETANLGNTSSLTLEEKRALPFKLLISLIILFLLGAIVFWVWQSNALDDEIQLSPSYPSFIDNTAKDNVSMPAVQQQVASVDSNDRLEAEAAREEDSESTGKNNEITNTHEVRQLQQINSNLENTNDTPQEQELFKSSKNTLPDNLKVEQDDSQVITIDTTSSQASLAPVLPDITLPIAQDNNEQLVSNTQSRVNDTEQKPALTPANSVKKPTNSKPQVMGVSEPALVQQDSQVKKESVIKANIEQANDKQVIKKQEVIKPEVIKPEVIKETKPQKSNTALSGQPNYLNQKSSLVNVERNRARNAKRQLDTENGVVYDSATALMWMTCSLGQRWSGQACVGQSSEYLWSEAMSAAEQVSYAGYNDWRLPTRQELNSIVSCTSGRLAFSLDKKGSIKIKNGQKLDGQCVANYSKPTIDVNVFPNTERGLYWSTSHSAVNNYSAWGVFFTKGQLLNFNTSNLGFVRLVRTN